VRVPGRRGDGGLLSSGPVRLPPRTFVA
jgi:hypothetical protein